MNFAGRVAVVTGGASGIGLGIARSLARRGVDVAILDIEPPALETAAHELAGLGGRILPLPLDVSDRAAVYAVAERVVSEFGRLDIAVNNAGIAYNAKPVHEAPDEMIDWSINVNLMGVLNGIKAFVPRIIATGQGGHIVNTSSIGGFQVRKSELMHQGLYAATKYAVTALSEGLHNDLEPYGIGVSILAPAAVATNIGASDRNRQQQFGGATSGSQNPELHQMLQQHGLSSDTVGERVIRAITNRETYIFTHPEARAILEARHREIEAAFDAILPEEVASTQPNL